MQAAGASSTLAWIPLDPLQVSDPQGSSEALNDFLMKKRNPSSAALSAWSPALLASGFAAPSTPPPRSTSPGRESKTATTSRDVARPKAPEARAAPRGRPLSKTAKTQEEVAQHAMSVIFKTELSTDEQDQVREETVRHWKNHVNAGFLQYRKSMAAGDSFAAVEWIDHKPGTARFLDVKGQEYIDCLGGFGIYNVGRRHPTVTAAVKAQIEKQPLHSQELLDPLRAYAANLLSMVAPGNGSLSHWFFINSGAEAVEAALKLCLLHTGRKRIVACVNAFHGKTLGALATTSKSVFRKPFLGALLDVVHVPFNDIHSLTETFKASQFAGNDIAGFIIEPIQGEGGIHMASDDYLKTARKLCDQFGACLIFDEIQSGMGRSGKWFASEYAGVVPDIITLGKAVGGGVMPVAACGGRAAIWSKYIENPFVLTTTFGGNPAAMAATIATINVILQEQLLQAARERGDQLMAGFSKLASEFPEVIGEVRGRGLMIGIEFADNDAGVEWAKQMFSRFVLTSGTLINAKVIRIEPPLTITAEDCAHVLAAARESVMAVARLRKPASKL